MTSTEFFAKIDYQWEQAHKLMEDPGEYRVRRGMGRPISGYTEDLLGVFLASNIGRRDQRFFIDKVVSYRTIDSPRAISFKPDVLIVNDQNVATHYFDTKTNLGRLRHTGDYLAAKNDFISILKSQTAWTQFEGEERIDITFSENFKYYMVVVFGWNINEAQKKVNLDFADTLPNVKLYHLETRKARLDRIINHDEFDRLITDTKNNLLP